MPWLFEWYEYTHTPCEPVANEEYDKCKGKLLRREIYKLFSFTRAGTEFEKWAGLPEHGYIPESPNGPIILEAKGLFFATPKAHKITLISDDGSRLKLIPGVIIIDNWGAHGVKAMQKELWLPPMALLQLTFFDNCWSGYLHISGDLI
jgi:hypothetical protein